MDTYNNSYIRRQNIMRILSIVAREEDINRTILSDRMNLSGAAITKIINPLVEKGFLDEVSRYSEIRQRKSRYLKLSKGRYAVACIRIARNSISGVVCDISGVLILQKSVGYEMGSYDDGIIKGMLESLKEGLDPSFLLLSAVLLHPGGLKRGEAKMDPPYFWDFENLKKECERELGVKLVSRNDSNAALIGEVWFGIARNSSVSSIVLYNVGRGIGASALINGRILSGYGESAVEIGHTSVSMEDRRCTCGNKGCLELYASTSVWMEKYPDFARLFDRTLRRSLEQDAVVLDYARTLSLGAAILARMYSPRMLILHSNDADYLDLDYLAALIKKNIVAEMYTLGPEDIEIRKGELGEASYALGAIAIALDEFFS